MVFSSELNYVTGKIRLPAGTRSKEIINFDEPVVLREFTFVPLSTSTSRSSKAASCMVRISINDIIAKILIWEPPGGIVQGWEPPGGIVEEWQPPVGAPDAIQKWQPPGGLVQKWQPPVGIVMTPNDIITVQLISKSGEKDEGSCQAGYVVLGTEYNGNKDYCAKLGFTARGLASIS